MKTGLAGPIVRQSHRRPVGGLAKRDRRECLPRWTKARGASQTPSLYIVHFFIVHCSVAATQLRKSPQGFLLAGFINPGGDLLSRDLSSDYHRRSNVSLPGSEWDRVGPLGYDHQVSDALLRGLLPIWLSLALGWGMCFMCGLCVCCGGSRLTSAWQCVWVSKCCVSFLNQACVVQSLPPRVV